MKWTTHIALAISVASITAQSPVKITIDTATRTANVSPILYGLMTEEINHSYDGRLYAEMIRNRTFIKSRSGIDDWNLDLEGASRATIASVPEGPSKALPTSMKINVALASTGNEAGVANPGWRGFTIRPGTVYTGSFFAKSQHVGAAHIRLISDDSGATLAETSVTLTNGAWKQYTYENGVQRRATQPGESSSRLFCSSGDD